MTAMQDPDSVVRYWAAIGLGNSADNHLSTVHVDRLEAALNDEAPCVRIAAARAVLKHGKPKLPLEILKSELKSEHQWGRLRAAIVLDEAGELARPLIPEIQACLDNQPNKYITRIANRTLNVLLGTDNQVK